MRQGAQQKGLIASINGIQLNVRIVNLDIESFANQPFNQCDAGLSRRSSVFGLNANP